MIDAGQLKAIFLAHLKVDFRRARAGGGALRQRELSTGARMAVSSLFYLLMGTAVGMTAFACRDRLTYGALFLGYVLSFLGIMILMEFGVMAMQGEDQAVLGPRPVGAATYTAAKALNLAAFVGFYGTALSAVPLVTSCLAPLGGPGYCASLLGVTALSVLAVTGYLLLGYGLVLRRLRAETARDVLNWITIAFSVAVPVAYMLLRSGMERSGVRILLPLESHPWLGWLPPVWLAELAAGSPDPRALAFLGASVPAWIWVVRFGAFRLGGWTPEASGGGGTARSPGLAWLRPAFPTPAEWGVFRLLLAYLRRDRASKARLYPQFGMPIAMFAVGAFQGWLADPWAGEPTGLMPFFLACYPALTCAWVPLLLRFSEQWEAAWIFAVAPGATLADMARGLQRATLILLMAPVFALTWLVFAVAWHQPFHALLHVLPAALCSIALMDLSLLWRRPVALSCRYIKGEGGTRLALTFTLMGLFTAVGVLQAKASGSLPLTGLLIGALLTAVFALDWALTASLSGRPIAVKDL